MWQKKVVRIKFWYQRTMSYISIFNSFSILFILLDSLNLRRYFWIALVIFVFGIVIVGYFEDKLGVAKAELEFTARKAGVKMEEKDDNV